jgi:hypothetical protein
MSDPINIPNTAGVVTVNTSTAEKTLLLPLTASIYGKIITIKDISSNAANCNITIQTRYPPDLFEDGRSNYLLKTNFGSVTFLAKSNTWYTLNNSSGSTNSIIDTNNLHPPISYGYPVVDYSKSYNLRFSVLSFIYSSL